MKKKLLALGMGIAIVATSVAAVSANEDVKISELQNGFFAQGNSELRGYGGFHGGMMRGFSNGYGYNQEALEEAAAESGLTVEEYVEKQQVEIEALREAHRKEMAEIMGIPEDEFRGGYGYGGRCGGGGRGGMGFGLRY